MFLPLKHFTETGYVKSKGKFVIVLNYTPHHKGMWGEWT